MKPDIANMVCCLPTYGPFITSLGQSTNSGAADSGATWLLDFVSSYLKSRGFKSGYIAAFDYCIFDIEALDRVWLLAEVSEQAYRDQGYLADCESPLPAIARYLVERMPAIWDGPPWVQHEPVTRTIVIADRMDTLIGFFGVGIMPTGSKDPYALRRAAKHLLMQVMHPIAKVTRHDT